MGAFKGAEKTARIYRAGEDIGRCRKLTGEGRGWYLVYLDGYRWPRMENTSRSNECVAVRGVARVRALINNPADCGGIKEGACNEH